VEALGIWFAYVPPKGNNIKGYTC